jgi:4'-phosphopantetheinyl transferase
MTEIALRASHHFFIIATHMNVDVWSAVLDRPAEELRELLSDDEKARADRFVTPALRGRFTIGRSVLRTLLGRYLDRDPAEIEFAYSARGKPSVNGINFNLSHSGGLAVYAFGHGCEIGIDIETIRASDDLLDVARRFFAANEYAELATLDPSEQTDAFFRCWTRKEAFLKATGEGIAAALDRFEVTLRADDPPALRWIDGGNAAAWHVHHFAPAPGYIGAVVAPMPIEVGACRAFSMNVS